MRLPSGASTLLSRHPATDLPDGGTLPSSPGAAGRPTTNALAPVNLSPMYISVSTISGSRLGGREVKGHSQFRSPGWWLHHLLIQGCWSTPGKWRWLVQSEEPVALEPSCSEWPLADRPSQWEVCIMGS